MKRQLGALAITFLVSGGLELTAGTANAQREHQWCPGDSPNYPDGPGTFYNWDWNICHTWHWVRYGKGNVPYKGSLPSTLWDGDTPPPDSAPACGRDMFTGTPIDC